MDQIDDIFNLIKNDYVLVYFKKGTSFYRDLITQVVSLPATSDILDFAQWTNYLLYALLIIVGFVVVGFLLTVIMDFWIVYCLKFYKMETWKHKENNCACSILSETFQIFIFVFCGAMVGCVVLGFNDLNQFSTSIYNMLDYIPGYNHSGIIVPVLETELDESGAFTSIIVALVVICVVYCAYAILSVLQIFSGYYCFCGQKTWYIYISQMLTYFGVVLYFLIAGIAAVAFIFIDDICYYPHPDSTAAAGNYWKDAVIERIPGLISNIPYIQDSSVLALSEQFIDFCWDNGTIITRNTTQGEINCQNFAGVINTYMCGDFNYFFSGGIAVVSVLMALSFFGLYWAVSYYALVTRGKNDDLDSRKDYYNEVGGDDQANNQHYIFDDDGDADLELDYYDEIDEL